MLPNEIKQFRLAPTMVTGLALIAFAAIALDIPFSTWVHDTGVSEAVKRHKTLIWITKWPGDFRFTLVVGGIVGLISSWKWRQILLVVGSGIVSGVLYTLVKWLVGRTRPFKGVPPFELHPFRLLAGNQAFPSGHACTSFATAMALAMLFPKWRGLIFIWPGIVLFERVLEGAHYPADAVAGALFGILSAQITRWIIRNWSSPFSAVPSRRH